MSRTLGALLCLLLLALGAPVTLVAAPHNGPGMDPDGARALPAGDLGPGIDPNGLRALPAGDNGPAIDPNG